MPWSAGPGAGFSSGRPWLPVAPDAQVRNVEHEAAEPGSVLNTYRDLLRLRRRTPALLHGEQELVAQRDLDVLAYVRRAGGSAAFVALNFAARPAAASVPAAPDSGAWRVGFSTTGGALGGELRGRASLAPLEAVIAIN
jgi:glycosidase